MSTLFFTDIHFGRRNNSIEHNTDCYNFVKWVYDYCINHPEITRIGFLGDWFENRNAIDVMTMTYGYDSAQLLNSLNIPILFCIGNHDLYKRYSREHFSTVHYNELSNFIIVDKPTIHDNMLFCPFLFEDEYDSLHQYKNIPIWAGHFEFEGFSITSYNTKKEGGPSHSSFKYVKLILSGHYHKRQSADNTTYIGNTFPMDFSDVNDTERGICILNETDLQLSFLAWPDQPTYHRIKYSEIDKVSFPPKSRVKCLMDVVVEQEQLVEVKKQLSLTGIREVLCEEPKIAFEDMFSLDADEQINVSDFSTLKQLLDQMIDNIVSPDIDNALLKSILNKSGEFDTFNSTSDAITFKQLSFKNLYSYGNNLNTVVFDDAGLFNLIYGENHDVVYDDNDKCKSGTGKSTILNAVSYCLYDRVIKNNVTFDDMINNINKANLYCELVFEKSQILYKITRRRKFGKKSINDVTFEIIDQNGIVVKDLTKDSAANTNKFIKDIIGLQFETFTRMVLFSASNTPFFSLPVTSSTELSQTDILEDLFRLKELTTKAENIKKLTKSMKDELKIELEILNQKEQLNNQKMSTMQNLINNFDNWEQTKQKDIERIQNQLQSIPENVERIISDIDTINLLRDNAKKTQSIIKEITRDINDLSKEQQSLNIEITALSQNICPFCKQVHTDEQKLKNKQRIIIENNDMISELTQEKLEHENILKNIEIDVTKLQYVDKYPNISRVFSEKAVLESKLEMLRKSSNPFEIALETIDQTLIDIDYSKKQNLTKEIEHSEFLVKLLTKKDSFVRKSLLKQNLPFLNTKINEYLTQLKLPHLVYFTEELLTKIELNGRAFAFSTISNGQIARVNIALCLAFRDVIARMHSPINLLMLDECLDTGLSANGVANTVKLIREKSKKENIKIFIVTHREEVTHIHYDSKFKVTLQNNFSNVQQES